MTYKKQLIDFIDSKKDLFIDINDKIWEFAEIGFQEYKSSELLCKALEEEGFEVQKGAADIPTAFIGSYGSGKPVIAILGEFDALPLLSQEKCTAEKRELERGGNGHGCGHNTLGTGALAACFGVKKYLEENNISGTIRYYGCPAEENGNGKTYMVREGLFNDVDAVYTWHPSSLNAVCSTSLLAVKSAYFKFKGVSAHAAINPHTGRSALDAVELMNVGCNYLREHIIPEAKIHYAITNSGGISPNVVQAEAEVYYYIRAPKLSQINEIYERVCNIAKGAALMTGTQLEINVNGGTSHYLPNTILNEVLYKSLVDVGAPKFDEKEIEYAEKIRATSTELDKKLEIESTALIGDMSMEQANDMLKGKAISDVIIPYKSLDIVMPGSTDVGDVSMVVPTSQLIIASLALGTPAHSWQNVCQSASSISHKGLLTAGKVLGLAAIYIINNPEIVIKAKEQHKKDLAGEEYVCPIPSNKKPGVKL